MALTLGTNCGFVTAAPTGDPATGDTAIIETRAYGLKATSPSDMSKVTEIGVWLEEATSASDYEVGIYDHDSGNDRPDNLLGSAGPVSKGTSGSVWVAQTVDISLSPSTIYWIVVQLDNTTTTQRSLEETGHTGERSVFKGSMTALPDPYGTITSANADTLVAFYALYEAAGPAWQINIGDVWKTVEGVQINIGDAWKTVDGAQINISDAWKES